MQQLFDKKILRPKKRGLICPLSIVCSTPLIFVLDRGTPLVTPTYIVR